MNPVGDINAHRVMGQVPRCHMQDWIGQFWVVVLADVFEPSNVVSDHHSQWLDAGKTLLQILAVSLHRSAEGPHVHPVEADADRAPASAGAERENLVEAV